MEYGDIFYSCRTGDLYNARYLVEETDVEINVRDQWNSTPLYYACLCGHESLVEFLLARGARCEPNTFDGERCVYAALTNRIKKLLKDFKAITPQCMRRDSYREFFRKCLEEQAFVDVCFMIHGVKLHAHRLILCAMSDYFTHMFQTKWKGKSVIKLNHPLVKPWAFQSILHFLYTDRLCVDVSKAQDCIVLAKQCKLTNLRDLLVLRLHSIESFQLSKPGTQTIDMISIEPESASQALKEAYSAIAELAIPVPLRHQQFKSGFLFGCSPEEREVFLPFVMYLPCDDDHPDEDIPPYADICFVVDDSKFYVHKVFFCGRSDYFKALLNGHFSEAVLPKIEAQEVTTEKSIPEITLHDVSPEVFAAVVAFIYQDSAEITVENLFNILCAADLYLLNGLKRICANQISHNLDVDNVISMFRIARMFSLESLESSCTFFITCYLDKLINDREFHELVLEDAASIKDRQEEDSIPIVDDIRFHLYSSILPIRDYQEDSMVDSDKKLSNLSDLLESLGLE